MLTDEEKLSIFDEYFDAEGESAYNLIERVERAVLKKLGEQEPDCWRITHRSFCGITTDSKEIAEDPLYLGYVIPLYAHPLPAQAVPEGSVIASTNDLKRIHRDLDACQKVIWLAGGFDPEYCKEAQESLMLIDSMLSAAPKPSAIK